MGGVLPCCPDPRDAVTPFEREGARLYFSRGRPVSSADVCGIKDQALSWWILEVALEMGLLKRGTPHFFFFWLAGGQLLLQTISCKWWPFLGGKCMFFILGPCYSASFPIGQCLKLPHDPASLLRQTSGLERIHRLNSKWFGTAFIRSKSRRCF